MILKSNEYIYIRVQGLIWILNGLVESSNVRINVGKEINNIYREENTNLPILVDFKNIESVSDHTFDELINSIEELKRPVVFLNINLIESYIIPNIPNNLNFYKFSSCLGTNVSFSEELSSINFNEVINSILTKKLNSIILESYQKFTSKSYLNSTPILAEGIFDANRIISNRDSFYWICLFLNDVLKLVLQKKFKYPIRLMSVSLRSAPFASVLSQMNRIPLETIDHLGPRHKAHDLDIKPKILGNIRYSYVYIGDFCFGGTEIKIAKTYAQIAQCNLECAIVIGTLLLPKTFENDFELKSIIELDSLPGDLVSKFSFLNSK